MACNDFASFRSHIFSSFHADCCIHVVVFDFSACNTLSQTMATATVSLSTLPKPKPRRPIPTADTKAVLFVCCSWFPYIPPCRFYLMQTTAMLCLSEPGGTATSRSRLQVSLLYSVLTLRQTPVAGTIISEACSQRGGCGPSTGLANAVAVRQKYGEPQGAG